MVTDKAANKSHNFSHMHKIIGGVRAVLGRRAFACNGNAEKDKAES